MDPQLVFERYTIDVIADAERAIRIDKVLGNHKQREALYPERRIRHPCEYKMHNICGVIVISIGDEHLLAEQFICLVWLEYCTRSYRREVRSRLRFGQVHRPRPFAGHHLWQIRVLKLITARKLDRLNGTLRQEWAKVESHIRGVPHFLNWSCHKLGQTLASKFPVFGKPIPSILSEPTIGFLEPRRSPYGAVGKAHGTLPITRLIKWIENFGGKLRGFFENGSHGFRSRVLEARQIGDLLETSQLGQHKQHVLYGGSVDVHDKAAVN